MESGQEGQPIQQGGAAVWHVGRNGGRPKSASWVLPRRRGGGTVAKTISAYDMAVSDAIYGPTDRYVSRQRLHAMLDYAYDLLRARLDEKRGARTAFFVFANTDATSRADGLGWLGIRFQAEQADGQSE